MSNVFDEKDQFDYHKHNSVYISDYIKFADAKAGVALSICGVLFAFFIEKLRDKWMNIHSFDFFKDGFVIMLILALIVLGCGMYNLLITLWPRYLIDRSIYHSWGGIAAFDDGNQYVQELKNKFNDRQVFLESFAKQNYALGSICKTKYTKLRLGFLYSGIGVVLAGFAWFFG